MSFFRTHKTERHKIMEICVVSFDGVKYAVDVGVDDTTADIRRKVASAAELCEDGFDMTFGEKVMAEGDDTTQLSAGDTVVLTKTLSQKDDAIAALRDLGETDLTSERFERLTDPKLIHLFLKAEVVTEIPQSFLRCKTLGELDLSGVPGVTKICGSVLENSSLPTADLSGWSNLIRIETFFLNNCSALRTLDLSGWNNLTHIASYFLDGCSALTSLDLSGWNNVTEIGCSFLSHCSALRTLDLSGWNNVTQLGHTFLFNCSALRTVDLSGWNNMTQIEPSFLFNCRALTTLDLSGWNNVTRIGCSFLTNCSALRTLDLSGWNNLSHVGNNFLFICTALETLDISGWTSVTHIETGFLSGCKIRSSSINVTGSSSVVSEYVKNHSLMDNTTCKCVCM